MLRVNAVSKRFRRPKMPEQIQEELNDCNPPLPCLLAVFSEHDAVEGCFDEDCQTMLEVTPMPNVIIPFNGETSDGVLGAFAILATVCETLSCASRLITIMPGNERINDDTGANP